MLRLVVMAVSGAMIALGAARVALGHPYDGAGGLVVGGGLILGGLLFERFRYKRDHDTPPAAPWMDTGERDVRDGKVVGVWQHPQTGERLYVRLR